ncbi:MAG: AraC family transcriptional regulator [Proteobacteria bacterium]|nr:AraC family transcriptional regulator [Pseudomonadota bacterium]MDE2410761.1 AraC family transcriptional regulator [Sphingomonadales bacterium]
MIRAGSMEGFRNLVFELGRDPAPMLLAAGIDPALLDQPDKLITTVSFRRALNIAALETGIARFGLVLSQRQTFEKLGAIGYLVRHAPNLAVSVNRLNRFLKTHDAGSLNGLEIDDDLALWTHNLTGVTDESAIQQTELSVSLGCRFVRSALGEEWCPDRVLFEHASPVDVEIYSRIFRCPVLFGQPLTALEFPAADLLRPLRSADPGLFEILERHVVEINSQIADDLASRVKAQMQRTIEDGPIRLDLVARQLGLSRHSLQSQLRSVGTSFQTLLDDVRFELARRYLRETRLPIAEVSAILGYAEPAVFTRAFSRRAGQTPRRWRQVQAMG